MSLPVNTPVHGRGSIAAAASPLAQESLARDIEEDPEDAAIDGSNNGDDDDHDHDDEQPGVFQGDSKKATSGYSMAGSHRRPSFIASGNRSLIAPSVVLRDSGYVTKKERDDARAEERSLLRDNHVIPPKHPRRGSAASGGFIAPLLRHVSSGRRRSEVDEEAIAEAEGEGSIQADMSETTPLIADSDLPYGGQDSPENIDRKWEEAVASGKIQTTWQREAKVLGRYSRSLVFTFLLQYSLPVASVVAVGHLGKIELGAVSLGSMTANITGYAVYQGLATSLDTLCAQAYGSGRKKLVGLQLQRMLYFLWAITIPIAIIWLSGTQILGAIVPEKETAELAGRYLKILIIGAPGYAAFEAGKRFVQAQGLFSATLYVLIVMAPLNAFLHWLFVWRLGWGFIGAPIAVAITDNLLPVALLLYVVFVDGRECWGGFSRAALRNWGPMIKLALPGLVMVLAEFLAFEILTLSASYISSTHLAAQSLLSTITATTYQIPFPMSVAASTRIANLIGATLADAARTSAKVALVAALFVGVVNAVLLSSLRYQLPRLFTGDQDVIELVARLLPLCAAFQLFDAIAAFCNGILRGIGRQEVGGYTALFSYYVVSLFLFPAHQSRREHDDADWGRARRLPCQSRLGPASGCTGIFLACGPALRSRLECESFCLRVAVDVMSTFADDAHRVSIIEGYFIFTTSFERAVDEAKGRNTNA